MDWHADRSVDEDLRKGAVECAPDNWNAPSRDEQGLPADAIALTEDVVDADADEIAQAERALGADEDGTPG